MIIFSKELIYGTDLVGCWNESPFTLKGKTYPACSLMILRVSSKDTPIPDLYWHSLLLYHGKYWYPEYGTPTFIDFNKLQEYIDEGIEAVHNRESEGSFRKQ